jgi:uncharacterized membrane protein YqjE
MRGPLDEAPASAGLFSSLRNLLDSALRIGQVRLALLGTELEEQKLRLAQGLVLSALGALLLTVACLLLSAFVVVLFWDTHRLAALAVLTLGFAGGGALLLRAGSRSVRSAGAMFQASLDELARDRAGLARPDRG